jgi:ABC-type dipeptide/oligopeptide/nickel transport system permease component
MVSYVLRRLLLMVPTLFGITVLVFLIARLAPGTPGVAQMAGTALDAEAQQAQREWYEKRYGLNLSLPAQYIRWWRGMFKADVSAIAWHDPGSNEPLLPVFTLRQTEPERFVRLSDGRWARAALLDVRGDVLRQTDSTLAERVGAQALNSLPPVEPGYAEPLHAFAHAVIEFIDSLDDVSEEGRLRRATLPIQAPADAPAWTDNGEPLYLHPDDPATLVYEGRAGWMALTPAEPPDRWRVLAINDGQTRSKLAAWMDDLPDQRDDYALPRHAFVAGRSAPMETSFDVDTLQRASVTTAVSVPSGLWAIVEGESRALMVWQAVEPPPVLLVQGVDGSWSRLRGDTLAELPVVRTHREGDEAFLSSLGPGVAETLPDAARAVREPRHAVFEGRLSPLASPPSERDLRRYQHPTEIFEITLGESLTSKQTVSQELERRLPVTLAVSLVAFPMIYAIAIPVGMLMAVKRGRNFDAASNVAMLGLWSIPTVLAATLCIGYLTRGGTGVEWFPNNGLSSLGAETWAFTDWLFDRLWHLVLPVVCVVYTGVAYLAKQMRAAMLDNFTMDYVRTAKAKGVRGRDIVNRHVLRNSLLPIITIFATILPTLIAGSIIVEKVFNIEGMGLLAFRAVQNRDYDVVQALALIAGALNLVGLLIADVCYALADPRITYR